PASPAPAWGWRSAWPSAARKSGRCRRRKDRSGRRRSFVRSVFVGGRLPALAGAAGMAGRRPPRQRVEKGGRETVRGRHGGPDHRGAGLRDRSGDAAVGVLILRGWIADRHGPAATGPRVSPVLGGAAGRCAGGGDPSARG